MSGAGAGRGADRGKGRNTKTGSDFGKDWKRGKAPTPTLSALAEIVTLVIQKPLKSVSVSVMLSN